MIDPLNPPTDWPCNILKNIPAQNDPAFDILGLSDAERKVLRATWNIGKDPAMISRHTKIPRSSLPTIIKRLVARKLLRRIGSDRKHIVWRADIFRSIGNLEFFRIRFDGAYRDRRPRISSSTASL